MPRSAIVPLSINEPVPVLSDLMVKNPSLEKAPFKVKL